MSAALHDVAIVGAGPVGATLALALAESDLDVVLLDAREPGSAARAERSLALSHGARLILERVGAWGALGGYENAVTPITEIDVSQAGGFGVATLRAREQNLPALGYVVSYRALQSVLDAALAHARIALRYGTNVESVGATHAYAAVSMANDADALLARLAVIADGSAGALHGMPRHRHDYRQSAVIAKVWCSRPHDGRAYERFTPQGPIALLPEQDHYGLVWTASSSRAQGLLALSEAEFLSTLAQSLAPRRNDLVAVRDRRTFPLALEVAPAIVSTRCAVIGNAAQALHPVAAQGLNLGLRDAYELARTLAGTPRDAIGTAAMLARYASGRRTDRAAGVAFTHGLLSVFGNASPWLRWPRGIALTALDALPPLKRAFTRAMLFGMH